MRSQSLHLAVEDVVLLHLVFHRGQVLTKALVVQVVLGREIKQNSYSSPPFVYSLDLTLSGYT